MNVIETINKRHSYRGKYKSDTVPREDLITIGIAETEPTLPKKRTFEERAWFNVFPNIQNEFPFVGKM